MLRVDRFVPTSGWPGTLLEIDGDDFAPALDDNEVVVGGERALVLRAAPDHLTVLTAEGTPSGAVEVTVGSSTAVADTPFEIKDPPDVRDSAAAGPPVFFSGPQHGTPKLRVSDQRVLVILAHGLDSPPADPIAERQAEEAGFDDADHFWREASFDRTSFQFDYTPWIELPRRRNAYIWDGEDIDWARLQYLLWTKRHATVAGSRMFATHQGFRLAQIDVGAPAQPVEDETLMNVKTPMHVAVKGTTAYVVSGLDGLFVIDIGGAVPAVVRHLAPAGRVLACDVEGDTLVLAALDQGIHVYDVSDARNPVLQATHATAGWATAVCVTGTRAYVGAGQSVLSIDLTDPANPAPLGAAPAGSWVMGLDVAGTRCVAATDGRGLATFDVSGLAPVHRANEQTALNLHAVSLTGTTAYAAAGSQGMHVVDVTNLGAPAVRKTVATTRACYGVAVSGTRAWLSVGGKVIVPADVADPANPSLGGELVLTGSFIFGADPDLATYRTNLKNANDSHGKLKTQGLFVDAIERAPLPAPGVAAYEGVCVVVLGAPGRAESWTANQVAENDRRIGFQNAKGLIWLASRAHWGRKAHEIGHWFGMVDIYEEQFDDGTLIKGTAAPWCMSGNHDTGPLFSGQEADRMQLYDSVNVERRSWNPAGGPSVERFDIVAHGTSEDAGSRIHLLELVVAKGLSYLIEVRRRPGGTLFDANIPLPAPLPAPPGRVLVTRVMEGTTINNTSERPTMLLGVLDVDEEVVDAARLLRIHVEERLQDNPLAYTVAVHWNEEPPPDPNGKFDLSITPWNTNTWESPDIWVNSPRNDGASVVYEFSEPGDPSRPILNGDRPWVKRRNTVHARIRNTGVQDVTNVYATCYVTSPPGIGDNGNWATLGSTHIPAIPANADVVAEFEWVPDSDKHTCISVAVMPKFGEIEPRNNRAQENVARFDSPGSSSHEPVILDAEIRSPFSVARKVDLRVAGLPKGWHAVVEPAWAWLEPKGAAPVRAVIWTVLHAPGTEHTDVPDEAFPKVEGWTDHHHRYMPIGGILAPVRANRRPKINWELGVNGHEVAVFGNVAPAARVPFVVEVTDERGGVERFGGRTLANGTIQLRFNLVDGRYALQAFTASTRALAEGESDVKTLELP